MELEDRYFCKICLKEIKIKQKTQHDKSKSHLQWACIDNILNKDYDFFMSINPNFLSKINIEQDNDSNNTSNKVNH